MKAKQSEQSTSTTFRMFLLLGLLFCLTIAPIAQSLVWGASLPFMLQASGAVQISITEQGFEPDVVTITPGTEVIWTNNTGQTVTVRSAESDNSPYNIHLPIVLAAGTSAVAEQDEGLPPLVPEFARASTNKSDFTPTGDWASDLLPPGASYSHLFSESGEYPFFLGEPFNFEGRIIVQSTAGNGPDLVITKSDDILFAMPSGVITYTLAYTNVGGLPATGVEIREMLPDNTTFNVSASTAGWTQAGSPESYIFDVGSLEIDANGTVVFGVTVDDSLPTGVEMITNTVSITNDGTDLNPLDNSASDTTPISGGPTEVCGALTTDTTWTVFESPYITTCNIVVNSGVTLTIEHGTVVKFGGGSHDLTVNGILNAAGTSESPIVFTSLKDDSYGGDSNGDGNATSPSPGDWDYIRIESGGVASLNHVILRYGGDSQVNRRYSMIENFGSLSLTNSALSYSDYHGLYHYGISLTANHNIFAHNNQIGANIDTTNNLSNATFTNNSLNNNGSYGAMINYGNNLTNDLTGNTGTDNGCNGILVGGSISGGALTWGAQGNDLTYLLDNSLILNGDSTLTIEPGVVLKGRSDYSDLTIHGTLVAEGTSGSPIVFTSLKDDNYAGDTNNDGSATSPSPGDWDYIRIESGGVASLNHVILRYGGDSQVNRRYSMIENFGSLSLTNSALSYSDYHGLYHYGISLTANHNIFAHNNQIGANIDTTNNLSNATFTNNSLNNNGSYGAVINYENNLTNDLTGNTGTDNGCNGILVGGSISGGALTWGAQGNDLTYLLDNSLILNGDSTLTIEPGVVLKGRSDYSDLTIHGTLVAEGTSGSPIVFTSLKDDNYAGDTNNDGSATSPSPGDWDYIRIESGGVASLNHVILRYGGDSQVNRRYSMIENFGSLSLTNSALSYSDYHGLYHYGISLTANHNIFAHNNQIGANIDTTNNLSNATFTNNSLNNNGSYGAAINYGNNLTNDLTGNTGTDNGYNGILVGGSISGGALTWGAQGNDLTYLLDNSLILNGDSTLTIEPGVVLKGRSDYSDLTIHGTLVAEGTSGSPIVFTSLKDDDYAGDTNHDGDATSPSSADWDYIRITSGGVASLNHVILRYGGDSNVNRRYSMIENFGSLSLTNSTLSDSDYHGLYHEGTSLTANHNIFDNNNQRGADIDTTDNLSNATFTNNTLNNNGSDGASINYGNNLTNDLTGNTGTGNGYNGILVGGTISGGAVTWGAQGSDWTYLLDHSLIVNGDSTLSIEAGSVLKGRYNSSDLTINGMLMAEGTSGSPIVFTSLKDDSYAGDTNHDGSTTSPTPGDWDYIRITSGGVASLNHVILRYGGDSQVNRRYSMIENFGSLSLTNSALSYSDYHGLYHYGISLTANHNIFAHNNQIGANIDTTNNLSNATFTNNSLNNNGSYGSAINYGNSIANDLTGNTGTDNGYNVILVGGSISGGALTWGAQGNDLTYLLDNSLILNGDSTLTIEPGVVLKGRSDYSDLTIHGTLVAEGTSGSPIVFTSLKDDNYAGDTNNDGSATSPSPGDWDYIRIESGGVASLNHVILRYGGDSQVNRRYSMIENFGSLSLTNSALSYSDYHGLYHDGTSALIRHNSFYGNALDGVHNSNTSTAINAEYNWWGNNSGPDPYGSGDGINYRTCSDGSGGTYICEYYVDADPWLGQQAQEAEEMIEDALPEDPVRNTVPPESDVPYIESVDSQYGFFFFGAGGVGTNKLTVGVDWNGAEAGGGTPGFVRFKVGEQSYSETGTEDGAEHNLAIEQLEAGFNEIEITAVIVDGMGEEIESTPFTLQIIRFLAPEWLTELGLSDTNFEVTLAPTYMEAEMSVAFPEDPFEATVGVPDSVPFIGGETGIRESKIDLSLKVRSDATGSVKLQGETGFKAKDQEVTGSVSGGGNASLSSTGELSFSDGYVGFGLGGTLKHREPIVSVIPPLASAAQIPGLRNVLDDIYIEGTIEPDIELEFGIGIQEDDNSLELTGVTGRSKLKTTVALGVDIMKGVEASVYGGGEASIKLQAPANPSHLKELSGGVFVGARLKVWGFKPIEEGKTWEWSYAPSATRLAGGTTLTSPFPGLVTVPVTSSSTGWRVEQPDYGDAPYAQFVAHQANRLASVAPSGALETPIVTNLYRSANPALTLKGNNALITWVHDESSLPDSQSKEIRSSWWDGSSWSTPVEMTDNTMSEFKPQAIFVDDDQVLAVWERINDPDLPIDVTLDMTTTRKIELSYATFDVTAQSWNSPLLLTNNDELDHDHKLAAGEDGSAMVIWMSNADGELIGTNNSPDTLNYAIWDGTAWSNTDIVADNVVGALHSTLAYQDANTAIIVLSLDTDDDLATNIDRELFYTAWNGSSWSVLTQLTDDNLTDESPAVLYSSSGERRLVWLRDEQITLLNDDWTAEPIGSNIESQAATLRDFEISVDSNDNLALLWQGMSEAGADLYYSIYDAVTETWKLESQLTESNALEKQVSPAFDESGRLMVAYALDNLREETRVISPTLTITGVTTYQSTDLYALGYTPDTDLELVDISLPQYFDNPSPGDTVEIQATVRNTGDKALTSPLIAFYDGNPSAGGTLITSTQAISGTLAGGEVAQVSVDWTVPTTPVESHQLYAILDPDDSINEADETNNQLSLTTTLPELAISSVKTYYYDQHEVVPLAVIANNGPLTATNVLVELREETITGTVRHSQIIPTLAPDAITPITTTWDVSTWDEGDHLYVAVVDSNDTIAEINETDNVTAFPVKVLPDLVIYAGDVTANLTPGSGGPVAVTVRNWGTADATNVTVTLYEGTEVLTDTTALHTWTIPTLPVDGDVTLNTTIDHVPIRLFAIANPNHDIIEIEESNNIASLE